MNDPVPVDNRYLKATLAMLITFYTGEEKIEIMLSRYGLTNNEIAELVGKKPDAVRMFLKRYRNKKRFLSRYPWSKDAA